MRTNKFGFGNKGGKMLLLFDLEDGIYTEMKSSFIRGLEAGALEVDGKLIKNFDFQKFDKYNIVGICLFSPINKKYTILKNLLFKIRAFGVQEKKIFIISSDQTSSDFYTIFNHIIPFFADMNIKIYEIFHNHAKIDLSELQTQNINKRLEILGIKIASINYRQSREKEVKKENDK